MVLWYCDTVILRCVSEPHSEGSLIFVKIPRQATSGKISNDTCAHETLLITFCQNFKKYQKISVKSFAFSIIFCTFAVIKIHSQR